MLVVVIQKSGCPSVGQPLPDVLHRGPRDPCVHRVPRGPGDPCVAHRESWLGFHDNSLDEHHLLAGLCGWLSARLDPGKSGDSEDACLVHFWSTLFASESATEPLVMAVAAPLAMVVFPQSSDGRRQDNS